MPRETALKILYKIDKDGAYTNIAVKDGLSSSGLDSRDKGFVTELVYGVVSRRLTLDYFIKKHSSVKLKKLSVFVLEILRMGIYQMYFMDKVPQSAAVNESVKLARRYAGKSSGFVNGVLRSIARSGERVSDIQSMSERYSFPNSVYELFVRDYGEERAVSIMSSLNGKLPMTIRVNRLKTDPNELLKLFSDECIAAEVSDTENCMVIKGMDVGSNQLYKDGYFSVQGEAAMLAAAVLNAKSGHNVIDMCAAPGGKTTYIAEKMNNNGKITAFDVYEHKTELIRKNAERLGIDIIETAVYDASERNESLIGCADRVMVDVPCSGLGIISKKPDIKWAFEESDLPKLQLKLLSNAASYLKSGGALVYSTCTLNKKENECVIEEFLRGNADYELEDFSSLMPKRFSEAKSGYITLFPDSDKTDGFFIAKIKRK